ncbi:MAG: 4-(cytidine 5'-diphospho)-2-C-methyl-D-erythritol kinase [Bacilli bacterium]
MMLQAYAKINLVINITGKRDDGYHNLEMVMLPVTLHDSIDIARRKDGGEETYVTCDYFELYDCKYNLVQRAVKILKDEFDFKDGFRITIYKRIPVSAGLGGGSADAAAVMLGIIKMLKLQITDERLMELGKKVGSDVPFCLFNKPAKVEGIGEKLTFIDSKLSGLNVLIAKPKSGLSTETVYKTSDNFILPTFNTDKVIDAIANFDLEELKANIGNALEIPAFSINKESEELKAKIIEAGFPFTSMSGSGSSIFTISSNKKALVKFMEQLAKENYSVEICKIK